MVGERRFGRRSAPGERLNQHLGCETGGDTEMANLVAAEAEFRRAVQREQAALMASGLGRVEVRTPKEKKYSHFG